MRNLIMLAAALAIVGCAPRSRSAEALDRYDLVDRHGSLDEKCQAAGEVRDAYLAEHNEERYRFWHAAASLRCNAAALADL